jgi:hypothetical protein
VRGHVVHGRMPDASQVLRLCGTTRSDAAWTWVIAAITCKGCRARLARRPQLANQIATARQLTFEDALPAEATGS